MKKILYVITKGNWGGAQKYVYEVATSLPKDHFDPIVGCGEGDILPHKLSVAGIPVFKIPRLGRDISIFDDAHVFFELIKIYKKYKPDVVHLNSSKIGGLGAVAARLAGIKKIIFTVHGFAFNEERPWIQKKIISFLSWLTIVFSTDIIFISELEMKRALKWPLVERKAHLIYNGIRTPAFVAREEARKILAEKVNVPLDVFKEKFVIGTIAELTTNKGLSFALDGLTPESPYLYFIIGKGELEEKLRAQIVERKLERTVYLVGFVENASTLMKAFDVFLLPSVKEGLPYVLLEAGLAETPIIATNVGGIPQLISESQGLTIEPRSPEAIKAALASCASHQTVLDTQAFKHKVETNHSLTSMVEKTTALYS